MKKTVILLLFIMLCLLGIKIISYKIQQPIINTNLLNYSSSRYVLTAQNTEDYGKYPIYYPPVSVYPGSSKYQLLLLYEKYQQLTKQQSQLFFATKRINELMTWGSVLPIEGTMHSTTDLMNIEASSKGKFYFESDLALYMQLINQVLANIQSVQSESIRDSQNTEIKRYLFQNQQDLDKSIKAYTIDEKKRRYMLDVTKIVFSEYNKKLGLSNNKSSSNTVNYPFTELIKNNDFGSYKLLLDLEDFKSFSSNADLIINNEKFSIFSLQSIDKSISSLIIPINSTTRNISLDIPSNSYNHLSWDNNTLLSNNIYTTDISEIVPFNTIALSLENVPANVIISIDGNINTHHTNIISIDLIKNKASQLNNISLSKKEFTDKITISLISSNRLSIDDIDSIRLTTRLVEMPLLVLEKQSSLTLPKISVTQVDNQLEINTQNLTFEERNNLLSQFSEKFSLVKIMNKNGNLVVFILQPKSLILYKNLFYTLIFLLVFLLIFNNKIVKRLIYKYNISSLIWKKLCAITKQVNFSHKFRKIILIIIFLLITVDIFLLQYVFDPLNFVLIFVMAITFSIRRTYKVFYIFAIISMTYAFIAYLAKQQIWLEKASTWTFELILTGIIIDLFCIYLYEKN